MPGSTSCTSAAQMRNSASRVRNEVLVRRGDTTGVGRIIEAIGPAVVTDAPDRGREVDLTLLVGSDYLRRATASRP